MRTRRRAPIVCVVAWAVLGVASCTNGEPSTSTSPASVPTGPAGSNSSVRVDQPAGTTSAPPSSALTASTTSLPPGSASTIAPTTSAAAGGKHPAFANASAAMKTRVGSAGGRGYLLVVRNGEVLHDESFGGTTRDTAMPVASTAKWMTAAVIMTLVDEGKLSLDDPLSKHLPLFGDGDEQLITIRQMLSHTSGIRDQSCIWNTGGSMSACVDQIAGSALQFTPGTAFSYGNASFHVAGRVIEVITGTDFQTAFTQRIAAPLEFTGTRFAPGSRNPSPAAGASTTVHDVANLLEMMQGDGMFRGRRILSSGSVHEIQRNQVAGYDTSGDYAVGITRIPTYGLGTWRDRVDGEDNTVVVSGNGARGYYPWIDHANNAYGIVAVDDQRGAEVAVPASRVVIDAALAATTNAG